MKIYNSQSGNALFYIMKIYNSQSGNALFYIMKIYNSQSGNALFYILIAIAMLAALSYAISGSMRTGSLGLSKEQSNIAANEIMAYGNALSNAMQNLTLIEGCDITEISFEHNADSAYNNASSPTGEECHIFKENGAALSVAKPPENANDGSAYIYSSIFVHALGNGYDNDQCSTSDCAEIVLFLKNLNKSVCDAINSKLGIETSSGAIPTDTGDAAMTKYDGTLANGCGSGSCSNWLGDSSTTEKVLFGKPSGCFEGGGNPPNGTYHYYHAIYIQ